MATRVHPFSVNGAALRRLRKRAGISQERLAAQVGTTRRHMIRLENGEHLPSRVLRDRLAEALDVSRSEIKSAEEDDEELPALPLNSEEFALLGALMGRLGMSLGKVDFSDEQIAEVEDVPVDDGLDWIEA
jgi:transcriptional regulator with XRE-family HTH domain